MTTNRRTCLLATVIAGALGIPPAPAQQLPPAATILDRFVKVTGGRKAYQSHRSEILTGSVEFPAQGLKGKIQRYLASNKEYSAVNLEGIGLIESGVSDGMSWEKSVLLGPRVKQGAEKEQAIREAYLNAPIFWRELYPKAETSGIRSINGEDCFEVVLTPASGAPMHEFYSKKTGLLLRTTTTAASQLGDVDVEVDVSDYKEFGGVLMPTRSKQRAATQELTITVEDVRVNETIPEDRFAPPADVADLLKKPAVPSSKH